MSTSVPSPETVPLSTCPTCSSELCGHLVCRVCGNCEQCDQSPAVAAEQQRRQLRIAGLLRVGIAREDLDDAIRALDELRRPVCPCGNRKRPDWSFCGDCYHELPGSLRERLKRHITTGYLPAVREAWALLQNRFDR